jgi:hypothetical protein
MAVTLVGTGRCFSVGDLRNGQIAPQNISKVYFGPTWHAQTQTQRTKKCKGNHNECPICLEDSPASGVLIHCGHFVCSNCGSN